MYTDEISFETEKGIINGVVINTGTIDKTFLESAWGHADVDNKVEMRTDTVIDMASVTKALATTTSLLICHYKGLLDFDRPFTDYLPEYTAQLKTPITVRDLATHISGFGQQEHYNADAGSEIKKKMLSVPPSGQHGNFEYSCWNFQLLGMIIEKLSGKSIVDFCREEIFDPLEMHNTSLGKPLTTNKTLLAKTCATEKAGQISDFIAFRLYRDGFTAGNAGAFSSAPDLAKFCKCMLRGGRYGSGKCLFSDYEFDAMLTPKVSGGTVRRSFGWIVSDEFKPEGFSERTIYHSGWSGQTIFMDIEKQFYAVVLTTRTLNEYERARRGRFKIIGELGKFVDSKQLPPFKL